MQSDLLIEQMTIEEKIQTMESLWKNLSQNAGISSPAWHEQILLKRLEMLKEGNEPTLEWGQAKKIIRDMIK